MSQHNDDLKVTVAVILERVDWIKASIEQSQAEVKDQRNQIDGLKKRVNYIFGGLAAFEFLLAFLGVRKA